MLPARDVGLRFQPGLLERIIGDVLDITPEAAVTHHAPVTVLPLLEMTLSQLWLRRQDGFLTHEAYRRVGGVSGSVTTWCDSALDELTKEQQLIGRRALTSQKDPGDLLGGTALAEGLEWSSRRRLPTEIGTYLEASRARQRATIRRTRRVVARSWRGCWCWLW
ncbi:nSTAND1 domain-containing NTPase [Streptomyces sp. NPDC001920]